MPKLLFLIGFLLFGGVAAASEATCLAEAIYYEARSEDKLGKLLVAEVVLNRTEDERFPNSVCRVVSQAGQFSWYKNKGEKNPEQWKKSKLLARSILVGSIELPETGSLFFHSGKKPRSWSQMSKTMKHGNHTFYRN